VPKPHKSHGKQAKMKGNSRKRSEKLPDDKGWKKGGVSRSNKEERGKTGKSAFQRGGKTLALKTRKQVGEECPEEVQSFSQNKRKPHKLGRGTSCREIP